MQLLLQLSATTCNVAVARLPSAAGVVVPSEVDTGRQTISTDVGVVVDVVVVVLADLVVLLDRVVVVLAKVEGVVADVVLVVVAVVVVAGVGFAVATEVVVSGMSLTVASVADAWQDLSSTLSTTD